MRELIEEYGAMVVVLIFGLSITVFGEQMLEFVSASL